MLDFPVFFLRFLSLCCECEAHSSRFYPSCCSPLSFDVYTTLSFTTCMPALQDVQCLCVYMCVCVCLLTCEWPCALSFDTTSCHLDVVCSHVRGCVFFFHFLLIYKVQYCTYLCLSFCLHLQSVIVVYFVMFYMCLPLSFNLPFNL